MDERLDWGKLTDWKRFQRLVNDLLAFEISDLKFIPSSPDVGIDGGFDGVIMSDIPTMGLIGKTSLQAKFIASDSQPAKVRNQMKSYLVGTGSKLGEFAKAKNNGCQNLILATNGKLKVTHKLELLRLKPDYIKCLLIFDEEELRNKILRYPWVKMIYFDGRINPVFIPPKTYFERKETQLSINHLEGLSNYKELKNSFVNFLEDKSQKVFYFYAPSGNGKTHFLSKLADINTDVLHQRKVLIVDSNTGQIENALREEILETIDQKYILVFDDVDKDIHNLDSILKLLKSAANIDIKVVISSRKASKFLITTHIRDSQLVSASQIVEMLPWATNELISLAKNCNKSLSDMQAEEIVRHYQSPYLISWVSNQISGRKYDFKELQNKLLSQIESEITSVGQALKIPERIALSIFFDFLCIIPFQRSDKNILSAIASKNNILTDSLSDFLDRLLEVGVIRTIGDKYRVSPDLKGDLLLQHLIENNGRHTVEATLDYWYKNEKDNLLFNLNSASQQGPITNTQEWIAKTLLTVTNDKSISLKDLSYIIDFLPVEGLNALIKVLKSDTALELTTDDISPLLVKLMQDDSTVDGVITILFNQYERIKEGHYDNYKLDSLVKELLNPLKFSYARMNKILDIFNEVLNYKEYGTQVILCSIQEILAGEHEFSESYGKSITLNYRVLAKNDEIIAIRAKAIAIICKIIANINDSIVPYVVDTIRKIGESFHTNISKIPLSEVIEDNRKKVIESLQFVDITKLNVKNQIEFEDLFLDWWVSEWPCQDLALTMLKNIERSELYQSIKFLSDSHAVILDWVKFQKEFDSSKEKSRRLWLSKLSYDADYLEYIAKEIAQKVLDKYPKNYEIVNFCSRIAEQIDPMDWRIPSFIRNMVKMSTDTFVEIRQNNWDEIPQCFRSQIESELVHLQPDLLKQLLLDYKVNCQSKSTSEILNFIDILIQFETESAFNILVSFINKNFSKKYVRYYYNIQKFYDKTKDLGRTQYLLCLHLKKDFNLGRWYQQDERAIDRIAHILTGIYKDNLVISKELISLITKLLKVYPTTDYHYVQIFNILGKDNWLALRILKYRLQLESYSLIIRYPSISAYKVPIYQKIRNIGEHLRLFLFHSSTYLFHKKYLITFDAYSSYSGKEIDLRFESSDDFLKLVNFMTSLTKRSYVNSHDVSKLLAEIIQNDLNSEQPVTYKLLRELINQRQLERSELLFKLIDWFAIKPYEYSEILDAFLISFGAKVFEERIQSIVYNKAITGSVTSTVGEIPKAYIDKINFVANVKSNVKDPLVISMCNDVIDYLNSRIDKHLQHEEEFLNAKS